MTGFILLGKLIAHRKMLLKPDMNIAQIPQTK